jgi:hypothetical protein
MTSVCALAHALLAAAPLRCVEAERLRRSQSAVTPQPYPLAGRGQFSERDLLLAHRLQNDTHVLLSTVRRPSVTIEFQSFTAETRVRFPSGAPTSSMAYGNRPERQLRSSKHIASKRIDFGCLRKANAANALSLRTVHGRYVKTEAQGSASVF